MNTFYNDYASDKMNLFLFIQILLIGASLESKQFTGNKEA